MFVTFTDEYEEYLRDESRRKGEADRISFPRDEEAVIKDMLTAAREGSCITLQGSRTGITAGAVPYGGHVLNFSRMNKITALRYDHNEDCFYISVQPGLQLADLRLAIRTKSFDCSGWSEQSLAALRLFEEKGEYFFPPDPTETSASLGGMAACNASGARSFHYGPVRNYIQALRAVLPDGSLVSLLRGVDRAVGKRINLLTREGLLVSGDLPDYSLPGVKNAAGYFTAEDMDLLDLFIGSEGTLAVVTSLELKLIKLPEAMYGLMVFFHHEKDALDFVKHLQQDSKSVNINKSIVVAVEFFNHDALELLSKEKKSNPAFKSLLEIDKSFDTGVYAEFHGSADDAEKKLLHLGELLEGFGGRQEDTWVALGQREMELLKELRHAVPEAVNLQIDEIKKSFPRIAKLGTDMAVPDDCLEWVMEMYNTGLEEMGLKSVIFGHIGNNHLHVNIIPQSYAEYEKGRTLYAQWASRVIEVGGSVSAEHGIGKLKTEMLKIMYGDKNLKQMLELKKLFDPACRLNRGNLFSV